MDTAGQAPDVAGDDLIDLPDQVGEAGETFFGSLANDGGAVANRVSRDRVGWDFHLQLPRAAEWKLTHTLDTRPAEPSCFVQVKSTTRAVSSWRVKLSNWERLAKDPRPVFFIVFKFTPGSLICPREAHLVHVGEDLLWRVLKELRSVGNDEVSTLKGRHMTFAWGEADRLAELTGSALRSAIARHVGDKPAIYEQEVSPPHHARVRGPPAHRQATAHRGEPRGDLREGRRFRVRGDATPRDWAGRHRGPAFRHRTVVADGAVERARNLVRRGP